MSFLKQRAVAAHKKRKAKEALKPKAWATMREMLAHGVIHFPYTPLFVTPLYKKPDLDENHPEGEAHLPVAPDKKRKVAVA